MILKIKRSKEWNSLIPQVSKNFEKLYNETIKASFSDKNRIISGLIQELNDKNKELQAKDKEFSDLSKSRRQRNDPYKFSGNLLICFYIINSF